MTSSLNNKKTHCLLKFATLYFEAKNQHSGISQNISCFRVSLIAYIMLLCNKIIVLKVKIKWLSERKIETNRNIYATRVDNNSFPRIAGQGQGQSHSFD